MKPITMIKRSLLKWLILTPVALSGIIAIVITLGITAWFAQRGITGGPHRGTLPKQVLDWIVPLGMIVGEWVTLWLWWHLSRNIGSFSSVFRTQTKIPWAEFGIGLAAGAVMVLLATVLRPPVSPWPNVFIILAALTAGFCEEFLFRGFLITLISRAGLGRVAQVGLSAVAFAVGHCYAGPWGVAWAAFAGLVFGSISVWRGNVWAPVTAHILVDMCMMLRLFSWIGARMG